MIYDIGLELNVLSHFLSQLVDRLSLLIIFDKKTEDGEIGNFSSNKLAKAAELFLKSK
jgi:hypothetical protein